MPPNKKGGNFMKKVARILVGACFGGICGWCVNGQNVAVPIALAIIGLIAFVVYQCLE